MTEAPPPRRMAPEAGPHLWNAAALSPADWMLPLGAEAAAEAHDAAPAAPLPRLDPVLSRVVERLLHGRGFVLLRGLPPPQEPDALLRLLGARMGEVLAPQPTGTDPLFNEACDMLLLLCTDSTTVVLRSAAAVHNTLLKANRAALEQLYQPLPQVEVPVFAVSTGVFSARLDHAALAQAASPEAVAALEQALEAPGLALSLPLRPGDVLALNPFLVWAGRARGLVAQPLLAREDSRLTEGAFAGLLRA
ncbi:TauD/TfdA family dioxygenase [Roseomonas sp. ACRSG]|nr:TauD/TfdA family dioxygenase [Roseomonas sp. ACRSG]